MRLSLSPTVVCDTGHNAGGWQYLAPRLASLPGVKHMVLGFVSDKDVSHILEMMPRGDVRYYFTRASIDRAMDSVRLLEIARGVGLDGTSYPTVKDAVAAAMAQAKEDDTVFVGGSTFVVADFLAAFHG